MSTTATSAQPAGMSIITCDRAECPRCESLIRHEHMERRPLQADSPVDWPRHHLLAWCDKCDSLWRATREMRPGATYEIIGVEEITDERIKRPYTRACQRKHGIVQQVA